MRILLIISWCCLVSIVSAQSTEEIKVINLSYKYFLNPSTGNLPDDSSGKPREGIAENIKRAVDQMNLVAHQMKANFVFRLAEDPIGIGGPNAPDLVNKWYNQSIPSNQDLTSAQLEQDAKQYPQAFFWRDNSINLYLTGLNWGGECSFPGKGEIIVMAIDADIIGMLQFHEIGHYFDLAHTHGNGTCAQPEIIGDDGIQDTYPDLPCWTQHDFAQRYFGKAFDQLNPSERNQVIDTWANIMSYRGNDLRARLTTMQMMRWEAAASGIRRKVIKSLSYQIHCRAVGSDRLAYQIKLFDHESSTDLTIGDIYINGNWASQITQEFIVPGSILQDNQIAGNCRRYYPEDRTTCKGVVTLEKSEYQPNIFRATVQNVPSIPEFRLDLQFARQKRSCSCDETSEQQTQEPLNKSTKKSSH